MELLGLILLFSFLGSVVSLVGGVILVTFKKNLSHKTSLLMVSFAAGVLLGTAFFDLLPEAMELAEEFNLVWVLAGIVFLFLFEKSLLWYHHHDEHHKAYQHTAVLIVVGDTIHNFIDGIVMAGAFMVSIPAGIVTSLAVAAHEIPHEIADFGVLLSKGWKRKKIVIVNLVSAAVAMVGAVVMYMVGSRAEAVLPPLLAFSGGSFLYLACSDLIPELHHAHNEEVKTGAMESVVFLMGLGMVWGLVRLLEG